MIPNCGGSAYEFAEKKEDFPDQIEPYCCSPFGFDGKHSYDQTLFRLPLRKHDSYSEIKSGTCHTESIERLFDMFKAEASSILLFLKHVQKVTILRRRNRKEESILQVELKNTLDVQQFRKDTINFLKKPGTPNPLSLPSIFEITIRGDSDRTYKWLVSQQLGTDVVFDVVNPRLRVVSLGGVACLLSGPTPNETRRDQNPIFCFLPLQEETHLPVIVNGFFEVFSNRKGITLASDRVEGDEKEKGQWNNFLQQHCIAPAYLKLLEAAKKHVGVTDSKKVDFYNLWPTTSTNGSLIPLRKAFYDLLKQQSSNLRLLYDEVDQKWKAFSECFHKGFCDPKVIERLSREGTISFTVMPPTLQRELSTAEIDAKVLSPSDVQEIFSNENHPKLCYPLQESPWPSIRTEEDVKVFLEYFRKKEVPLEGLPLLLTGDDETSYICRFSTERMCYAVSPAQLEFRKIFPLDVSNRVVHPKHYDLVSREKEGVLKLSVDSIVAFVSESFPSEWKDKERVEWDQETPPKETVRLIWKYFYSNGVASTRIEKEFQHWPLVPTADGNLFSLQESKRFVICEGKELGGIMKSMNFQMLDVDVLPAKIADEKKCCFSLTEKGFIETVLTLHERRHTFTDEEKIQIRERSKKVLSLLDGNLKSLQAVPIFSDIFGTFRSLDSMSRRLPESLPLSIRKFLEPSSNSYFHLDPLEVPFFKIPEMTLEESLLEVVKHLPKFDDRMNCVEEMKQTKIELTVKVIEALSDTPLIPWDGKFRRVNEFLASDEILQRIFTDEPHLFLPKPWDSSEWKGFFTSLNLGTTERPDVIVKCLKKIEKNQLIQESKVLLELPFFKLMKEFPEEWKDIRFLPAFRVDLKETLRSYNLKEGLDWEKAPREEKLAVRCEICLKSTWPRASSTAFRLSTDWEVVGSNESGKFPNSNPTLPQVIRHIKSLTELPNDLPRKDLLFFPALDHLNSLIRENSNELDSDKLRKSLKDLKCFFLESSGWHSASELCFNLPKDIPPLLFAIPKYPRNLELLKLLNAKTLSPGLIRGYLETFYEREEVLSNEEITTVVSLIETAKELSESNSNSNINSNSNVDKPWYLLTSTKRVQRADEVFIQDLPEQSLDNIDIDKIFISSQQIKDSAEILGARLLSRSIQVNPIVESLNEVESEEANRLTDIIQSSSFGECVRRLAKRYSTTISLDLLNVLSKAKVVVVEELKAQFFLKLPNERKEITKEGKSNTPIAFSKEKKIIYLSLTEEKDFEYHLAKEVLTILDATFDSGELSKLLECEDRYALSSTLDRLRIPQLTDIPSIGEHYDIGKILSVRHMRWLNYYVYDQFSPEEKIAYLDDSDPCATEEILRFGEIISRIDESTFDVQVNQNERRSLSILFLYKLQPPKNTDRCLTHTIEGVRRLGGLLPICSTRYTQEMVLLTTLPPLQTFGFANGFKRKSLRVEESLSGTGKASLCQLEQFGRNLFNENQLLQFVARRTFQSYPQTS